MFRFFGFITTAAITFANAGTNLGTAWFIFGEPVMPKSMIDTND